MNSGCAIATGILVVLGAPLWILGMNTLGHNMRPWLETIPIISTLAAGFSDFALGGVAYLVVFLIGLWLNRTFVAKR